MNYFQRALEKDPNYALAYTGIALVWSGRQQMGFVPSRGATSKGKAAALKALELDDTLAEAHWRLATVRSYEWNWAGAEAEFRRAIELNPNFPHARAVYSLFLMSMRRPEEAMAQIERALELDPHNPMFQLFYGLDLEFVRRYDDAIVQYRNALRTTPNLTFAQWGLWRALHLKQMYAEALEEAKKASAALGDHEVEEALDRGYAQGGYQGAMRRAAETLAARSRTTFVRPVEVASLYTYAGDNDRALEWLEKGYEERDASMPFLGVPPPDLDPLQDDPRFQDLLRRMNFPPRP